MRDQDRKTSETKDWYTPRRERELIRQIKAGKKELLEDVIAHYYDEILRYVIWQIRDPESACDLTQEVFCRFIRRVDRYEYRNLRAYLYAAARNLCEGKEPDARILCGEGKAGKNCGKRRRTCTS